jgi:DNA-binding transcriptional regulator YdaS (Cro superfamily)
LKRGDKKKIAATLGVHPEWVSRVIRGEGVSEPILKAAEQIIHERADHSRRENE